MKRCLVIIATLVATFSSALALARPVSAGAPSGLKEAYVAFQHVQMAYEAQNIDSARTDLQEAINCLGGPTEKNFSAAVENPCSGQGKGAIRDIKDEGLKYDLRSALGEASFGLKRQELRSVKMRALSAMDYLRSAREEWNFQILPSAPPK